MNPVETLSPIRAVVANVRKLRPTGPGGAVLRSGTKHFSGGTKVYVVYCYGGRCERITVVGKSRSGRYIRVDLDVNAVENFRVKMVYKPSALIKLRYKSLTEADANAMCNFLPQWQAGVPKFKAELSKAGNPQLKDEGFWSSFLFFLGIRR